MTFSLNRSNAARTIRCVFFGMSLLAPWSAPVNAAAGAAAGSPTGPTGKPAGATPADNAASLQHSQPSQPSQASASDAQQNGATQSLAAVNPVAIRDTLAKRQIQTDSHTLNERIDKILTLTGHAVPHDPTLASIGLNRELVFTVPVPYGVLYQAKKHEVTVDADLSGDDVPGSILLKKSVKGPNGQGLVVAPEAKKKGFIQHIDLIELKVNEQSKTLIHTHFMVPQAVFDKTRGDFAVQLRCMLVPPYLKDVHEHSDPTDENPTDVTTRTSTLFAAVHEIWLINAQSGMVLTRKLHLSN
jgi:hypothetical protein